MEFRTISPFSFKIFTVLDKLINLIKQRLPCPADSREHFAALQEGLGVKADEKLSHFTSEFGFFFLLMCLHGFGIMMQQRKELDNTREQLWQLQPSCSLAWDRKQHLDLGRGF